MKEDFKPDFQDIMYLIDVKTVQSNFPQVNKFLLAFQTLSTNQFFYPEVNSEKIAMIKLINKIKSSSYDSEDEYSLENAKYICTKKDIYENTRLAKLAFNPSCIYSQLKKELICIWLLFFAECFQDSSSENVLNLLNHGLNSKTIEDYQKLLNENEMIEFTAFLKEAKDTVKYFQKSNIYSKTLEQLYFKYETIILKAKLFPSFDYILEMSNKHIYKKIPSVAYKDDFFNNINKKLRELYHQIWFIFNKEPQKNAEDLSESNRRQLIQLMRAEKNLLLAGDDEYELLQKAEDIYKQIPPKCNADLAIDILAIKAANQYCLELIHTNPQPTKLQCFIERICQPLWEQEQLQEHIRSIYH